MSQLSYACVEGWTSTRVLLLVVRRIEERCTVFCAVSCTLRRHHT